MITWRLMVMSVKSCLEYRVDFFFRVAVGSVWHVTVLAFAIVLVTRFPGVGGWEAGEVLLIAAIRMAGHSLATAFFFGPRWVSMMVQEGKIDAFLLRPMPVYRQVLLNYFHIPIIGDLFVVPVLFGVALAHLVFDWTPARVAYLVLAVLGAMLLEAAVQTFLGAFALRHPSARSWQDWAEELMGTFGNYPLHILPGPAQAVFMALLPIAFCAYFPVAFLTGHAAQLPVPTWVAAASPAISAALYLASLIWWRTRIRRYESIGG